MSGLGRVPSFEPDEEAKAMIESMFAEMKEAKEEVKEVPEDEDVSELEEGTPPTNITPGKRHRVRIPEPPEQTKDEQEEAIASAQEELDIIHSAFMEFSEKTSDLVIYGYMYNEISKLAQAFQDMEGLLADDIDKDKITKNGLDYYEKMRKIRKRVLTDIYNTYRDEK